MLAAESSTWSHKWITALQHSYPKTEQQSIRGRTWRISDVSLISHNPSCACVLFWNRRGFFLAALLNKPCSVFFWLCCCGHWRWTCSPCLRYGSWNFFLCIYAWCDLRSEFPGTSWMLFHSWLICLTVECWSPKCLEIFLQPFKWIYILIYFYLL